MESPPTPFLLSQHAGYRLSSQVGHDCKDVVRSTVKTGWLRNVWRRTHPTRENAGWMTYGPAGPGVGVAPGTRW
jgi:hypothetical protein